MLYVGHFSFAPSRTTDRDFERGSFTCLVEADGPDAAADKFRNLIERLDDSFEAFESVGDIFLDNLIEVRNLPEEGLLTRYEDLTPDAIGTLSTTLPGVPEDAAVAYSWGSEDQDLEADEGVYAEPFMRESE